MLTRETIVTILDEALREQVYYQWLVQQDLFDDDYQRLVYPFIGTDVWNQVYCLTGQSPDMLSREQMLPLLRVPFNTAPFCPPPVPHSPWSAFYLPIDLYRHHVQLLDDKLCYDQLRLADHDLFLRQHRF